MKTPLLFAAVAMWASTALAADEVPDLTGADERQMKAHLGRMISLRGNISSGKQGASLAGATQKGVSFYVIAALPPKGGVFSWPEDWNRMMKEQRRVRVTGVLHYRDFSKVPGDKDDETVAMPQSYYYMVLQRTKVEPLEASITKPNR